MSEGYKKMAKTSPLDQQETFADTEANVCHAEGGSSLYEDEKDPNDVLVENNKMLL